MDEIKVFDLFTDETKPLTSSQLLQSERDAEIELRKRESDAIASRFADELTKRSPTKTMSPDYIASQPKTAVERYRVTPEEVEEILFHYASTSSIPKTTSLTGLPVTKVRAVVYSPALQDDLANLRLAMRQTVIRKMEETQTILLDALQDPDKLLSSSLTQISDVLREVSEIQMNLVASSQQRSMGLEMINPTDIFSGDELEHMAFLRRKLQAAGSGQTALPSGGLPGPHDASAVGSDYHDEDVLDPDFTLGESEEVDISDPKDPEEGISLLSEFAHQVMQDPDLDENEAKNAPNYAIFGPETG